MLANSGVYGHDDKVHHYHHHHHHQQHVYHHEQHDRGGHLPRNISLSTIFTSPPLLPSKTTTIKTQQQPDHQHQQHDGGGDLLRNVSRSRHQLDSKPGLLQKAIQGEGSYSNCVLLALEYPPFKLPDNNYMGHNMIVIFILQLETLTIVHRSLLVLIRVFFFPVQAS